MLIIDVDGTLTDGKIYISPEGEEFKAFNIKDGYGISNILPAIGVIPVIITGRSSDIVIRRATELGIIEVFQDIREKSQLLEELCRKYSISPKEVAFIGDDNNDIPIMQLVGLSFAPSDCSSDVKGIVNHMMISAGGQGAVRECIEYISEIKRRGI